MRTTRPVLVFVLAISSVIGLGACNAVQKAAREDPMKCERDPKCQKRRGRTADCSMQCTDDPACMERCEQVQAPSKLGR